MIRIVNCLILRHIPHVPEPEPDFGGGRWLSGLGREREVIHVVGNSQGDLLDRTDSDCVQLVDGIETLGIY